MNWSWTEAAAGRDGSLSLPAGWTQSRVGHVSRIINGMPYDSKYFGTDGEPLIRIRDLSTTDVETRYNGPQLTEYRVSGNTLLIGMDGEFNTGRWRLSEPALLNQRVLAIESGPYWSKWLEYCLPFALNVLNDLAYSTTVKHLSSFEVARVRLPTPPEGEMKKIANYLDRETAEIDAAIADQEKFMKLLNERRQSLTWSSISGADQPSNRVKTGDDFWRSIPDDWTLQKLGWHFKIGNGSTPSTSTPRFWSDSGFPWVNSSVVNHAPVIEPVRQVTDAALQELHLPIVPSGSLLVGITGQGKTRGTVTKLGITTTINQHVAYMTPLNERIVTTDYTRAALTASYPQLRHISDGNGGTKGALTCEMLQQFKIPIPPRDVQDQTVETLSSQSERISSALDDASAVIDLARERRAALITAAVTGQIDVTAKNKPAAEQLEDDVAQGLHREYA